jgi:uncharacterized protein YfaS (alpha-2-macroglobulin family)
MSLAITSMTFDQAVYNPGDTITLTVIYTSTDAASSDVGSTVTATVTDASTSASQSGTLTVAAAGAMLPVTAAATDTRTPSGTWTLASDTVTGSNPWTGTAVLTSVA